MRRVVLFALAAVACGDPAPALVVQPPVRPALPALVGAEAMTASAVIHAENGRARLVVSAADRAAGWTVASAAGIADAYVVGPPDLAPQQPAVLLIDLDEAALRDVVLGAWVVARVEGGAAQPLARSGARPPRTVVAVIDRPGTYRLVSRSCSATALGCDEPSARCTFDRDRPALGRCGLACSRDAQCGAELECVRGACGQPTCERDLDCRTGACLGDGRAGACVLSTHGCAACEPDQLCWRGPTPGEGACLPAGRPPGACSAPWPSVGCWSRDERCDVRVRPATEALARSGTVAPDEEGVWQMGSDVTSEPGDARAFERWFRPLGPGAPVEAWCDAGSPLRQPFLAISCADRELAFDRHDRIPPWSLLLATDVPPDSRRWPFVRFHAPISGRWRFDGETLRRGSNPSDPPLDGIVPYLLHREPSAGPRTRLEPPIGTRSADGTRFTLEERLEAGERIRFMLSNSAGLNTPTDQILDLTATFLGP